MDTEEASNQWKASQYAVACLERLEQDLSACVSALDEIERTDTKRGTLMGRALGAAVQLEELRDQLPDAPGRARLEVLRAMTDSIKITPEDASALRGRFGSIVERYRDSVRTFFDPANESQADDLAYRDAIEDLRGAMRRRKLAAFVTDVYDEVVGAADRQLMSLARDASELEVTWIREVRRAWCREQAYRWWWFLDDIQAQRVDSPSAPYWPPLQGTCS